MSRPDDLPAHHRRHLEELIPACPHLTALASRVREFAAILTRRRGHDLDEWISAVRADDLPALRSFAPGLEKDKQAVIAGLTLPYSNGPMEGANTKVKLLKRQMYGGASFALLRRRILLSQARTVTTSFVPRAEDRTVPHAKIDSYTTSSMDVTRGRALLRCGERSLRWDARVGYFVCGRAAIT